MGFLKELFEKKLKASSSIRSREYADFEAAHSECGGVSRSAHSEWALPQLRVGAGGSADGSDRSNSSCAPWDEAGGAADGTTTDSICYLQAGQQVQGSAKSFSFAVQRRQQLEAADKAASAVKAASAALVCAGPATLNYESITQFSQKVELYRGSVATVLKGVCVVSGARVIIKTYHKSKMHPKHHTKLAREVDAMRVLVGPYVAQLFATFEDASNIYLVMEFCEGGDLFKTMLMHGGLLDEQWVCVEVILPLLRILEKMHAMQLLHRDIKPENIFLTAMGKFKLGDFGLAINCGQELAFSRSGTLDYMAPEVLKNPSVPFQEGRAVDLAMLSARGVKPYGAAVDVWAAGVLAYELVCGRPPFEVDDEAQTAALIMYSDAVKFPPNRSPAWANFVRSALVKAPEARPSAAVLLKHPWIMGNLQRSLQESNRPSKEMLLRPLPLDLGAGTGGSRAVKRTLSLASGPAGGSGGGGSNTSTSTINNVSASQAQQQPVLPALPAGGMPAAGNVGVPTLPAAFPATPTGAARNAQQQHHTGRGSSSNPFIDRDAREARTLTASTNGGSGAGGSSRLSGLALSGSSSASGGSSSGIALAGACSLSSNSNGSDYRRPDAVASLSVSLPSSPKASLSGGSAGAHLSHLNPSASSSSSAGQSADGNNTATAVSPPSAAAQRSSTPTAGAGSTTGRASGAGGSPLRPHCLAGLRVALPLEGEALELPVGGGGIVGSGDSFCYSPTTPAPKPGIKERMKFYFQRQAGGATGSGL